MEALQLWLASTKAGEIMRTVGWLWQAAETLHFLGLSLLIGTVGLFDLRLLGMARGISLPALHRLIPWGVFGYAVNALTGFLFLSAHPDQYLYNAAFHFKMLFMAIAGINVVVFYLLVFGRVKILGPGDDAPAAAKAAGAISLVFWIGVVICGRLLTFYRP